MKSLRCKHCNAVVTVGEGSYFQCSNCGFLNRIPISQAQPPEPQDDSLSLETLWKIVKELTKVKKG